MTIPFAAFSLARIGFLGSRDYLATGVFLTYLIPSSLLFIPLFLALVGALGLINNVWCLVLIYPTLVPSCTWIMIGYFSSPKELDEVALIDGASYPQILFRIFIPVAIQGIIAATIFAFTVAGPPVSDGLPVHERPDGADGRHHHQN